MATRKKRARRIKPTDLPDIWKRLKSGEHQHVIAASYLENQGRISEIKNYQLYGDESRSLGY
jgi:hypothetical protein